MSLIQPYPKNARIYISRLMSYPTHNTYPRPSPSRPLSLPYLGIYSWVLGPHFLFFLLFLLQCCPFLFDP